MIHRWQQKLKSAQEYRADILALKAFHCHRCLSKLFNAVRSKNDGVINTLKMLSKSGLKNSKARFVAVCPSIQDNGRITIGDISTVLESYKTNISICAACS
jgi:hypothetical protein